MKNKLIEFKNVTKTYIVGENVALVKDVTNTTKKVKEVLNSECDNDTTVIIVTHNQLIKVIHIKNGEVDKVIINKSKKNIDEVIW